MVSGKLSKEVEMLVLSRKCGEKIIVGDDIVITVVRAVKGGVRIGIEAPRDLVIIRRELGDEKKPVPVV